MACVDVRYFTVISALACLCLRLVMTASIDTVLCVRSMALRSSDFLFGAELCFLGIIYILCLVYRYTSMYEFMTAAVYLTPRRCCIVH